MEIGSVYEINPQQAAPERWKKKQELCLEGVEKYGKQNAVYTASGREAISLALLSLEKEYPSVNKCCLMPAYMCDTVFIPFVQRGWELIFYHVGKNMKTDEESLKALVNETQPGVIFIHPYYGVDTWKELRPLLAQFQTEGMLVMEDVTQSYYMKTNAVSGEGFASKADYAASGENFAFKADYAASGENLAFKADYIVGSLRKWYAIPDGGFVTTNRMLCDEAMGYSEEFSKRRLLMHTKKWEYLQEKENRGGLDAREKQQWVEQVLPRLLKNKEEYLALNRQLEEELDRYDGITGMTTLSSNLLSDVEEQECEKRRRENFQILHEGLKNRSTLLPVLGEEAKYAASLYYPVYMEKRSELQSYLQKRDIFVPVLWPIGRENKNHLSEDEKYIYSHLAAIPMDQRYGREDMQRIIDVISEFEKNL